MRFLPTIALALSLVPCVAHALPAALSRLAVIPHSRVVQVSECVTDVTGIEAPEVLPEVRVSPLWTLPAGGSCCAESGAYAKPMSRAKSLYLHRQRLIVLSQSADDGALAHELAADALRERMGWKAPLSITQKQTIEKVGYHAEKMVRWEGCR